MRILILSSKFGGGGISAYVHELIKCFSGHHELSIVLGDDSANKIKDNNVRVYYLDNADISEENAVKILTLINEDIHPELIIGSQSCILPLIAPFIDDDIRIITVSHSLKYVEADIAGYNSQYYDSVVALSEYGKKHLIQRFCQHSKGKVVVIPNSVASVDGIEKICRTKEGSNVISIVYPGGTNPPKTPEIVVRTLLELKKTNSVFNFYWLGNTNCPIKHLSTVKDVREIFNDDPRIHIMGFIPREDALSLMEKANIVLLPSRREGSSVSLLEAMCRGTIPIVADFNNANKEVVVDGENGFIIKHRDKKKFAEKIIDIINNPSSISRLYHKTYLSFQENYSYDIWFSKMGELINSISNNHKRRGGRFNKDLYKRLRLKQQILHKYDYFLMLLHENFPTSIALSNIYLKKKILESRNRL